MQWHYAKNNEALGPVDEAEFQRLSLAGVIGPKDLVWNESFGSQWRPADTVPEWAESLRSGSSDQAEDLGTEGLAGGTAQSQGGSTPNKQLMLEARAALAGRWGISIAVCLLFYVILIVSQFIPFIGWLISLLISGALVLGFFAFFLTLVRRRTPPEIGLLFQGFSQFGTALGVYFLTCLFSFLWFLLAMVPGILMSLLLIAGGFSLEVLRRGPFPLQSFSSPGAVLLLACVFVIPIVVICIIIQLRYAMTYFILIDQPANGPLSAIRNSIAIMRGRKWKLFCLQWRFFGWSVLCLFTCGIGFLWLYPYMMAAFARFYEEVRG